MGMVTVFVSVTAPSAAALMTQPSFSVPSPVKVLEVEQETARPVEPRLNSITDVVAPHLSLQKLDAMADVFVRHLADPKADVTAEDVAVFADVGPHGIGTNRG